MDKDHRFPELLQIRVPRGTNDALKTLASRQYQTASEVARQAVIHVVQSSGLMISTPAQAEESRVA